MKKHVIFLVAAFFACLVALAQTPDPVILSSSGGTGKGKTISLDWTLGEVAVETASSTGKLYTQGFQQPNITTSVTTKTNARENRQAIIPDVTEFKIVVAPNPVTSIVNVRVSAVKNEDVLITITDGNGALLMQKTSRTDGRNLQINMNGLPAAPYVLTVRNGSTQQIIKTFKLIKAAPF